MNAIAIARLPSRAIFGSFVGVIMIWAAPALATDRYWTGRNSANWSDPNNWSPIAVPQNGDHLWFGFNDESHQSMVNDLSNLTIGVLNFASSDHQINGNTLTLSEIENNWENNNTTGHPSYSTTINCPLIFTGDRCPVNTGGFPGEVTQTTIDLHLNGPITVQADELDLWAQSSSQAGGGNGHLYVSGVVSGPGDVSAAADDYGGNPSVVQFDGTPGNTFSGTLFVETTGNAQINFDKSSGVVATNRVATSRFRNTPNANLNFAAPNQLGDHTILEITAGHTLLLSGDNVTVGSLVLTNSFEFTSDTNASTLDMDNMTVGLNYGITSWNDNPWVTPIVKGKINLIGTVDCDVNGTVYAGLEMPASLASFGGLAKNGGIAMLLESSNTFTGAIQINSGTLDCRVNGALGHSSGVQLNGGALTINNLDVPAQPLHVTDSRSILFANGPCSWGDTITLDQHLTIYAFYSLQLIGAITGAGGLNLNGNTIAISGTATNTFSGTTTTTCTLLTLGKNSIGAFSLDGPLIIGNSSGPSCEVRWLSFDQINDANALFDPGGTVTLFPGALMNLTGHEEEINTLTFDGGVVSNAYLGTLYLNGSVIVNSNSAPGTIQGGYVWLPSQQNFNIATGQSAPELTIGAQLTGPGGINKFGSGTLALTASNSYSNFVFINDGVVDISNPSALGGASSATTVELGGTLQVEAGAAGLMEPISLNGGGFAGDGALYLTPLSSVSANIALASDASVRVDSGAAYLPGVISGPGALTKIGAGTLQLGANDTRGNTYAGATYVNEGTLLLFKASGIESVPNDLVIGGAHQSATARNVNSFQIGGVVTVNQGGLWDLSGSSEGFATASLQGRPALSLNGKASVQTEVGFLYLPVGGDVYVNPVGSESSTATISGNIGLDPGPHHFVVNHGLSFQSTPDLELAAALTETSGAASIAKDGFGEMSLNASNNFSGAVTITGGALLVQTNGALGSGTAGAVVTNTGALFFLGNILVANDPLTLSSSTQPALRMLYGNSEWQGPVQLASNSVVSVDDAASSLEIYGAITGPGGLAKLGPGALALSGMTPNTYSGLTVISNGVLKAIKATSVLAVGGDVAIGDDLNPATNAIFLIVNGLLPANGNIAVHQSGLFDNENYGTMIHALTGAGYAHFGADLVVSNDVSFEFDGNISGAGALTKFGAGTMKLTADSPAFTGAAAISNGTYQVEGAISNSPVSVGAGATLVGNGVVGDVNTTGPGFVRTDTKFSGHSGGNLGVGNFSVTNGGTLALNLFGNAYAHTRQNDSIVTGGAVTLSNAELNAAFQYPPRDGDNLFLIQKHSAGSIAGAFNGFAEGAQTTIGTVPVTATYTGGDGNDFVLVVSNLALVFNGYQLAGGNGNQTLEPDECNLLYVTLTSRRTSTLAVTNAFLRATAPGTEVIIPQALFPLIAANGSAENSTPFQIRTGANSVGTTFELILGVAGEGQFSVPFSIVAGTDLSHPTGPCEFPVVFSGTFSSNSPIVTAPLLFDGDSSVCFPSKNCPGVDTNLPVVRYAVYNFTNSSPSDLCIGAQAQLTCPNAPANVLGAAAYLGTFDPAQPCANYLGDSGGSGPPFPTFYFDVPAGAPFQVVVMDRTNDFSCNAYTLEMFGLPNEPPTELSVWTNRAGGDFNTNPNWDVHLLPTITSNALVEDLGSYFSITNNLPVTFYELRFTNNAATITGSGDMTLNGPFRWGLGNFDGAGNIFANGGMQINTGPSVPVKQLSAKKLINNSAAAWIGAGTISLANGAMISNSPSGVFDCTDDGTIQNGSGTAIANGGLFRKIGGTNSTTIQAAFFNSGTVQVQTGSLYCYGGLTNFGNVTIPANSTLTLGNVSSFSSPASAITGAGNLVVNGAANLAGTVNLSGSNVFGFSGFQTANLTGNYVCTNNALIISSGTANFNGTGLIAPASLTLNIFGTLGGSNRVTVSGPTLLGTSATLSGSNAVVANGGLTISPGVSLSGRTLVNTAAGIWSNNLGGVIAFTVGGGSVLSNAPGASFEFSGNETAQISGGGGTVANAGFLRKTGAGSTTTLQIPFTNSGPVSVESGTLAISGGGTTTSNITVESAAGINFGGGTFTLPNMASITGAGNFAVSGGTPNFAGTVSLSGSNTFSGGTATFTGNYFCTNNTLTISAATANFNGTGVVAPATLSVGPSATLGGSNLVTVGGPMILNVNASLSGTNLVVANGGLTINSSVTISGRTLVNNAAALWTNMSINTMSLVGGWLSNAPSGTFDCVGTSIISGSSGGGVVNEGLFRKIGTPGTTTVEFSAFTNNGTVELDSGTFSFSGADYVQNSGVTFLNGGNFANTTPLKIFGGVLTGTGLVSGAVTNAALVSPGASPGQIIISDKYTQTAAGALAIELGGTNPVTGVDRLIVSNTAALGGALEIAFTNGFYPPANGSFVFLICGSRSGTFATFNYPSNLVSLALNYTATNATLLVLNTPPIIAPIANQTIPALSPFSLQVQATDNDVPAQTLTYALTNSPTGASINSTGLITWTPSGQATTNITVLVTDNGAPPLTASRTFQVNVVNAGFSSITALRVGVPGQNSNTLNLIGVPGLQYLTQYSTNLPGPWFNLMTNVADTNGAWIVVDPSATNPIRLYRAQFPESP